ncbi:MULTISPECIES: NYN domain-containing protein [unclassified Helicobacter]|uniref:NYN domain-containing protein n=1 Tax=unclassified Helicobacter TaxID=2593540 RepID=UPI000CF0C5CB|nr:MULTISPECIES: NYN domain-containing protein [unclassified Helicobacter]
MKQLDKEKKIALFIDCENIPCKWIDNIFESLLDIGDVCIKKAYGDWRNRSLKSWDKELIRYSIQPVHIITGNHHKSNKGVGKNSSDIQLVIDVMNCLYDGIVDCIAIASSDSDFAPLAQEIRSRGMQAIGFGEIKSREDYQNAFTSFEMLKKQNSKEDEVEELENNKTLIRMLKKAIDETSNQTGLSLVSDIGIWIKKNYSQSARTYGKKTWGDIFKELKKEFSIHYGDKNIMMVEYNYW